MHSSNTTGTEKRTHPGSLLGLPTIVANEFTAWEPDWFRAVSHAEASRPTSAGSELGDVERRFLHAIVNNPGRRSSENPKLARVGARRALQIRERLLALGYIKEQRVSMTKRGRPSTLFEPTRRAHDELRPGSEAEGS